MLKDFLKKSPINFFPVQRKWIILQKEDQTFNPSPPLRLQKGYSSIFEIIAARAA